MFSRLQKSRSLQLSCFSRTNSDNGSRVATYNTPGWPRQLPSPSPFPRSRLLFQRLSSESIRTYFHILIGIFAGNHTNFSLILPANGDRYTLSSFSLWYPTESISAYTDRSPSHSLPSLWFYWNLRTSVRVLFHIKFRLIEFPFMFLGIHKDLDL